MQTFSDVALPLYGLFVLSCTLREGSVDRAVPLGRSIAAVGFQCSHLLGKGSWCRLSSYGGFC